MSSTKINISSIPQERVKFYDSILFGRRGETSFPSDSIYQFFRDSRQKLEFKCYTYHHLKNNAIDISNLFSVYRKLENDQSNLTEEIMKFAQEIQDYINQMDLESRISDLEKLQSEIQDKQVAIAWSVVDTAIDQNNLASCQQNIELEMQSLHKRLISRRQIICLSLMVIALVVIAVAGATFDFIDDSKLSK